MTLKTPSDLRRQLRRQQELAKYPRLEDGRRLVDGCAVYFVYCFACGARLYSDDRALLYLCDDCEAEKRAL